MHGSNWSPLSLLVVEDRLSAVFGAIAPVLLATWWRDFGLPGALAVVLLMGGAVVYVLRLNRDQGRLHARLETQLQERNRAEEALRESEAFYHSLVETLPANIIRKDDEGRFTFANRRFCALLNRPLDQIVGRTDADFYPPELAEKYRRDDIRVMESGEHVDTVEENVTADGERRYVHVVKIPLYDALGRIAGIQGIFWDVTEQKRATEALAASEERFILAVRGSNDGLWDWNLKTDDVYFSPRFKELLGYEDHELPNRLETIEEQIHPDDRVRNFNAIREHLRARKPYAIEYRLRTKAGEYRWFLARGQAVWDDASGRATRMAGSISDIHARKVAEDLLRAQNELLQNMAESERKAHEARKQAQSRMVENAKLAGLGQMVAGVAHEINNPLSFVGNNVAVLQRDVAEMRELILLYREAEPVLEAQVPELAERIKAHCDHVDLEYTLSNLDGLLRRTRDGLQRIQNIVRDLRVFARLDESELNEVDLNAGIESSVNIIQGYAKRKKVKIETELHPLPLVSCFAAKINQVVMNLLSNAIDACPDSGTVTIRSVAEAEGAAIEVADNGCGIDPAIRERIFDPFFTTKPVGIGTGLGLSISYGIILDHGGTIEVESEPGAGSRFIIHLPTRPPQKVLNSPPRTTADPESEAQPEVAKQPD